MSLTPKQVRSDAEAVFDVIIGGGIAIVPLDVAYAIIGHKEAAIRKIFEVKKRSLEKPSGMFACVDHSLALHDLGEREREIQRTLIDEFDLPFSVVAPFNPANPALAGVDPYVIETSSKAGTLDMLLNAGAFHNALSKLCFERGKPAFGSSANISLTGSKFTVADVEPELKEVAEMSGVLEYDAAYITKEFRDACAQILPDPAKISNDEFVQMFLLLKHELKV